MTPQLTRRGLVAGSVASAATPAGAQAPASRSDGPTLATDAQARAGEAVGPLMDPLRTAEAIRARAAAAAYAAPVEGAATRTVGEALAENPLTPEAIGGTACDSSGALDATIHVQTAIDRVAASGGGPVLLRGTYLVGDLHVPANVVLLGRNPGPSVIQAAFYDYYAMRSQLRQRPGTTVTLASGAGLSGLLLIRAGLPIPCRSHAEGPTLLAAMSGTAITAPSTSVSLSDLLVLGHDRLCDLSAPGGVLAGAARIVNVRGDNRHGISLRDSADVCKLLDCHLWPYLTVDAEAAAGSMASLWRDGVGFHIGNRNDWSTLVDCFAYGYRGGDFRLENCSNIGLVRCGADCPGDDMAVVNYAIVGATAEYPSLVGCTGIGGGTNLLLDTSVTGERGTARLVGNYFASSRVGIELVNGGIVATGNHFEGPAHAVSIGPEADFFEGATNHFTGVGERYAIEPAAAARCVIDGWTPWLPWLPTPVPTGVAGAFAARTGGRWRKGPGVVEYEATVRIADRGRATGFHLALPVPAIRPSVGTGGRRGGALLQTFIDGDLRTMSVVDYKSESPLAAGAVLQLGGSYPVA